MTVGMRMSRRNFLGVALAGAGAAWLAACGGRDPDAIVVTQPTETSPAPEPPTTEPATEPPPEPTPGPEYDPDLHRIVTKEEALPDGYVPEALTPLPAEWHAPGWGGLMLRALVVDALQPLIAAAAADGVDLRIRSAYRSYEEQITTFAHWVEVYGEEQARRESALPGHSEHQLGTTMDFADPANGWELDASFEGTTSGLWVATRAHEFGFAMSYPPDSEAITGYIYEPWHFRYIGVEPAAAWKASGLTLVEFLRGLEAAAA